MMMVVVLRPLSDDVVVVAVTGSSLLLAAPLLTHASSPGEHLRPMMPLAGTVTLQLRATAAISWKEKVDQKISL